MTSNQTIRWVFKPAVFLGSLVPFVWLAWSLYTGNVGADPLNEITHETGVWALRFLCITLAMTPLRRLAGWNAAIRFRRMVGLFAFFYGTVHLLIFIVFDRLATLNFPSLASPATYWALAVSIGGEIAKRPYITIGFTSWVCMLLLALTSTTGMIRRLGGKRWQALHRLVYVSAIAGVLHYWWLVKARCEPPANVCVGRGRAARDSDLVGVPQAGGGGGPGQGVRPLQTCVESMPPTAQS